MTEQTPLIQFNRTVVRALVIIGLILTVALIILISQVGYEELIFQTKSTLSNFGTLAPLAFIAIQIIQVIYPVIPGGLTLVVGHLLFGLGWGFTYSFIGVTIGSIINFLLARKYGRSFARAFVSEETYEKYIKWISKGKRFDYFLGIAFLLPGFPDDFLCMVAGLTKMTFRRFMIIYMICKPITLFVYGVGGAAILNWTMNWLASAL